RWCLSRIRARVDDAGRQRVRTDGELVRLDLSADFVDALEIERGLAEGVDTLAPQRALALASLFEGDFLDGLELSHAPLAEAWLSTQRRHFRAAHAALLARCAANETGAAALPHLERWLALEPFELRAHRALLDALLADGRVREAQAHFALAERLFESEGLDRGALHAAWRELRQRAGTAKAPVDIARACDPQAAKGPSGTAAAAAARRPSIAVTPC